MAVVQWDPSREISFLQGDVNRLFERFFGAENTEAGTQRWVPPIDITEEGDHFILRADLPGMSESDIEIEVQDSALSISGERSYRRKPEHDGGFRRIERAFGKFQRTMTLPEGIDADAIDASFDNGVLELQIPKPVEAKPRRISIGSSKNSEVEGEAKSSKKSIKDRVLS